MTSLLRDVHLNPPATLEEIELLEKKLNLNLPDDYKELMLLSNGGEGQVGSAYFLFWPIEKIVWRNESASIKKYMSEKFIGIASNGGDECYALDYTEDVANPRFAIVPLGDLSHDSKFVIADSIGEAFAKANNFEFSDQEYNSSENECISDEIRDIAIRNIRFKANLFCEKKSYSEFLTLMDQIQKNWTDIDRKKVIYAKKLRSCCKIKLMA